MDEKPTILVCAEYYLPGFRAGGPIRSLSNLVEHLSEDFRFKVLTADRDHGVDEPYDEITYGDWMDVGPARVRYLSPAERSFPSVARLLAETDCDVVYVNSLYSTTYSLPAVVLSRFGLLGDSRVVVAPRGQLAPSAIAQGSSLKRPYLHAISASGLYDDVVWHATNEEEAARVRRWFGDSATIRIAPNLGTIPPDIGDVDYRPSPEGSLELVYLSRIHPVKNLDVVFELLNEVQGEVSFDIVGPVDDREYAERCERLGEQLPANVEVTFHGPVPPTEVVETIRRRDLFILPTQGENFGHVIFEALSAGTPALISDQTPWEEFAQRDAGWTVALDSPEVFAQHLQAAIDASPDQLREWGRNARRFAEQEADMAESVAKIRRVFETALGERG